MRVAPLLPRRLRQFLRRQPVLWWAFTRLQPALLSDDSSVVVTVQRGPLAGFKIGLGHGTPLYYWLDGHDEPAVVNALARLARRGTVAVDIGANIGMETLLLASAVGPSGTVVSVEPDSSSAARLRTNCRLNRLQNVVFVEKAISDHTGVVAFSASGELTSHVSSGLDGPAEMVVPCVTIGDLLRDVREPSMISVIKIDVEGHEAEVLEGAREFLSIAHPALVLEVHTDEALHKCVELIVESGYRVTALGENEHLEELLEGRNPSDCTFVRGHLLATPR